jgi:hypothetical protein
MPSAYLASGDLATYGVTGATDAQIAQASTIVDGYLERPEGLVWMPDSSGLPAYMAALTPSFSTTLSAGISPGSNVVVPIPAAAAGMADWIGEALVLDRVDSNKCEACAVVGVDNQNGTITLGSVAKAHGSGATVEAGLQIVEERALASKRSLTRVSRSPVVRVLAGVGRYSYGRRSDQVAGLYNDTNLLAAIQTFGGPPQWIPFDVRQAAVSVATGEIWVPAGLLLAYYSEVRLRYVAGYSATAIPPAIKRATANIVTTLMNFSYADANPAFKIVQAGGTKLERWSDSMMDADTKSLLEPFRLKLNF